jgi:Protein of unknown function (DUF3800)
MLYYPATYSDKWKLMIVKGFFDESNKNSKHKFFLLAGWTAPVEEWETFTIAWSKCLAASPSIKYFKSSESKTLSGQFERCTREIADEKKRALAKIIGSYDFRCYISSAKYESFADRPKELREFRVAGYYGWAFMNLIAMVLDDHLKLNDIENKIDFVFDGCSELRASVESYERERKRWLLPMQNIAGEIIPGNDRNFAGLQAADMLTGELSLYSKTKTPSDLYNLMLAGRRIIQSEVEIPKNLIEEFSALKGLRNRRKMMESLFMDLRGRK